MIVLVLCIAAASIALAIWYFSEGATIKRELRSVPVSKIRDVSDGHRARIVGGVRPVVEAFPAPLTGRPCVYAIATIEERRSRGKSHYWKRIAREEQGIAFFVEDDTGRALVDAANGRLALEFDAHESSGFLDNPEPNQLAFLQRHGESGTGMLFNRSLRYREAIISVDEVIAVLGEGVREPDPDAPPTEAYRGDSPTRLRLTSSPRHPLVVSDDPTVIR